MHWLLPLLLFLFRSSASAEQHYLTATAVVSDSNGDARIQCWQFETPFTTYPTTGMAMHLGLVANVTVVVLPARSREGLHRPPHPMLFVLLTGLAHVTLPNNSEEVWIMEGVNGFIVAVDTIGVGHYTDYPSDKETVALQIPFSEGIVPGHKVLKNGPCQSASQVVDRLVELDSVLNEL